MTIHCNCPCTSPAAAPDPRPYAQVISYAQWFLPKISVAFDTPIKGKTTEGWFFDASFVSRAVIELPECNFEDFRCYLFSILLVLFVTWKIWSYFRRDDTRNQTQQ